jgi:hypothetical protein
VGAWPGANAGTQFAGTYELPGGTTVWIVWREINMPNLPPLQGKPEYFRGRSPDELKGGLVGLMLFGEQQDGSRVIYDCVVRFGADVGG